MASTTRRFFSSTARTLSKNALLFPGQGSQAPGLLVPYLEKFPRVVKPVLEEMDESLKLKLSDALANKNGSDRYDVNLTMYAQPAILATSYAIVEVLKSIYGKSLVQDKFVYSAGHSLGEYSAATVVGSLEFADAVALVHERGRVMEESKDLFLKENGQDIELGMYAALLTGIKPNAAGQSPTAQVLAVVDALMANPAELSTLNAMVKNVEIGNINSGSQIVLSGPKSGVDSLLLYVKTTLGLKRGFKLMPLNVSAPFHSPIMAHAEHKLAELIQARKVQPKLPSIPLVSYASGKPFESTEELTEALIKSCTRRVYWLDSINYLTKNAGVSKLVSVGPGNVGDFTKRDVSKEIELQAVDTDNIDEVLSTL